MLVLCVACTEEPSSIDEDDYYVEMERAEGYCMELCFTLKKVEQIDSLLAIGEIDKAHALSSEIVQENNRRFYVDSYYIIDTWDSYEIWHEQPSAEDSIMIELDREMQKKESEEFWKEHTKQ
jgi:hypothetical protein